MLSASLQGTLALSLYLVLLPVVRAFPFAYPHAIARDATAGTNSSVTANEETVDMADCVPKDSVWNTLKFACSEDIGSCSTDPATFNCIGAFKIHEDERCTVAITEAEYPNAQVRDALIELLSVAVDKATQSKQTEQVKQQGQPPIGGGGGIGPPHQITRRDDAEFYTQYSAPSSMKATRFVMVDGNLVPQGEMRYTISCSATSLFDDACNTFNNGVLGLAASLTPETSFVLGAVNTVCGLAS